MTTFEESPKSATSQRAQFLSKVKWILVGIVIIGLGILLGYLLHSPETTELTISILALFIVMVIIIKNPLNGVLVWLFFMPFLETWIKIPLGAGIPDLSFSRFLIAFVAVSMLARAAIGRFHFARIGLADVCIIATAIGIMAAAPLSVSPDPMGVIQIAVAWHFTPLAVYFFTKNLVRDHKDLNRVFLTIAILAFVSGVYAAYERATGDILFLEKGVSAAELGLYRGQSGIRMIRGIWGGSGDLGRAMATAIPVTFYLFLENKENKIPRIFSAAMLVAGFYGIFVAMSRTPWYALLIALFVMQFFYPKFRGVFLVIVFVTAIVLWATWAQVGESDVANRIGDKVSTLEGREVRWQAGYNMWRAKPIRGWGFGWYEIVSGRFRTDGSRRSIYAIENDYLHILVGSGLIGFLPYLLFLLAPLVNSLRLALRMRSPDWSGFIKMETIAIYWAVILSLAITSYTAIHAQPGLKLIAFAVAGAVVGSHETMLVGSKQKSIRATDVEGI